MTARVEQCLDLERELRGVAGREVPKLDGGGDQFLEPLRPVAKGAFDCVADCAGPGRTIV